MRACHAVCLHKQGWFYSFISYFINTPTQPVVGCVFIVMGSGKFSRETVLFYLQLQGESLALNVAYKPIFPAFVRIWILCADIPVFLSTYFYFFLKKK
jgi:hypothetical protein